MIKRYSVRIDDDFKYNSQGDSVLEEWKSAAGKLHRLGGPAQTIRDKFTGKILRQQWQVNGKLDRADGPAYCQTGYKIGMHPDCLSETWYREGVQHRDGGPSRTLTHLPTGIIVEQSYEIGGKPHRLDGPAIIRRDPYTEVLTMAQWFVQGVRHRLQGPEYVLRDSITGIATTESWYINGLRHRADGPASIERNAQTGEITKQAFYVDGQKVAPFDFGDSGQEPS